MISVDAGRRWTWGDFRERIAGVAGSIRGNGGGRWLVAAESSFDFAVALFGVWHGGGVAVLPSNLQRSTLGDMADGLAGTVGDDSIRTEWLRHILPGRPAVEMIDPEPLDDSCTILELYTSGSTGSPSAVPKCLAQFDAELREIESNWGMLLGDASSLSTVSHSHIFHS